MVVSTPTKDKRGLILDELALLASASAQTQYERDVPHAFIAAELIERFATDLYHPKSSDFVDAFTEAELKDLAHLYGLVHAAAQRMQQTSVHSVSDLQKLPEWRQVMSLAKTLHDRFQRA
jgi:uncharacterized alpha-E superfamily protein